jgi:hypothetical protein
MAFLKKVLQARRAIHILVNQHRFIGSWTPFTYTLSAGINTN